MKERLCQELNLLVQQSAHAQLEKLEQVRLQGRFESSPSFLTLHFSRNDCPAKGCFLLSYCSTALP